MDEADEYQQILNSDVSNLGLVCLSKPHRPPNNPAWPTKQPRANLLEVQLFQVVIIAILVVSVNEVVSNGTTLTEWFCLENPLVDVPLSQIFRAELVAFR